VKGAKKKVVAKRKPSKCKPGKKKLAKKKAGTKRKKKKSTSGLRMPRMSNLKSFKLFGGGRPTTSCSEGILQASGRTEAAQASQNITVAGVVKNGFHLALNNRR
jgi:hypothetical protein